MTTIGVLGGGQLARMLAVAGLRLGCRLRVFDPVADPCAAAVAGHVRAPWDDEEALERFCDGLDLVTVEFENVPAEAARVVGALVPLRPSLLSLTTTQDRLAEKELARTLGIGTPRFARVDSADQLDAALEAVGTPAVLKSRRGGYDGRGQAVVRDAASLHAAWREIGERPCVLEGFVRFDREVSQVAVRGTNGELAFYPLAWNEHRDGVLHRTVAPAPDDSPALEEQARAMTKAVLEALDHVGVLTVEFFQCGDRLLMNEIAPRVHNSGHWTIEGAATSQFENHLRAVAGLPLGSTEAVGVSVMRNILGEEPDVRRVLGVPGAALHLYGKAPAPRRKIGHVTLRADSREELARLEARLDTALAVPSSRPAARTAPERDSASA